MQEANTFSNFRQISLVEMQRTYLARKRVRASHFFECAYLRPRLSPQRRQKSNSLQWDQIKYTGPAIN